MQGDADQLARENGRDAGDEQPAAFLFIRDPARGYEERLESLDVSQLKLRLRLDGRSPAVYPADGLSVDDGVALRSRAEVLQKSLRWLVVWAVMDRVADHSKRMGA